MKSGLVCSARPNLALATKTSRILKLFWVTPGTSRRCIAKHRDEVLVDDGCRSDRMPLEETGQGRRTSAPRPSPGEEVTLRRSGRCAPPAQFGVVPQRPAQPQHTARKAALSVPGLSVPGLSEAELSVPGSSCREGLSNFCASRTSQVRQEITDDRARSMSRASPGGLSVAAAARSLPAAERRLSPSPSPPSRLGRFGHLRAARPSNFPGSAFHSWTKPGRLTASRSRTESDNSAWAWEFDSAPRSVSAGDRHRPSSSSSAPPPGPPRRPAGAAGMPGPAVPVQPAPGRTSDSQ